MLLFLKIISKMPLDRVGPKTDEHGQSQLRSRHAGFRYRVFQVATLYPAYAN
jgi:hypothetical protein